MTIAEAEVFYSKDKKEYLVNENKELLKWLEEEKKNGYEYHISIDGMQKMINYFISWYEIKYPNRMINNNREDVPNLESYLTIDQLKYRLSDTHLAILECNYGARGHCQGPVYDNCVPGGWERNIVITLKKDEVEDWLESSNISIFADYDGVVKKRDLERLQPYIGEIKEPMSLEEICEIFNNTKGINYDELKESILYHKVNLELRDKILSYIALGLLYSKTTIPEKGYYRAKKFIEEMNKELKNINLTTNDIDYIMSLNYKEDPKPALIEEPNVSVPNEQEEKPKNLFKRLFRRRDRKPCNYDDDFDWI